MAQPRGDGATRAVVTLRMTREEWRRLRYAAVERDETMVDYAMRAVREALERDAQATQREG